MEMWLVANDEVELTSLNDWLRREGALRGRVRLVRQAAEMGALWDAVAVGSGGALTILAKSLTVWLRQPRRSTVKLALTRPDGTKVEISGGHVRFADELERLLQECLRPSERG